MKTLKNITITVLFLLSSIALQAQSKQISLSAKNRPIKEVFAEIQQKSGYRILYNDEIVADDLRVSVETANESVENILKTLLQNSDLTFIPQSEELIIITKREYVGERAEIFGTVTDEHGKPVPFANIVLFQPDDTTKLGYGAVTDMKGYYKLANVKPNSYRLQVSFVGYKTCHTNLTVPESNIRPIVQNFTLETDELVLKELVVEGQRPALKVDDGKLVYHIPTLLKNTSATNAYDAVKEIPGVMEQGDNLVLIGTSGMTVLLNDKKTSMTYAQLMTLLKSIPISHVEDIEIMYSVPPRYNIRGAVINVKLKQSVEEELQNTWQGEVAGEFRHRYYPGGEGRTSLVYLGKRTMVDLLYSYGNFRSLNKEILTSNHTLNGTVYDISQQSGGINKYQVHNTRLALQYTFYNKDIADVSYTGLFDSSDNDRTASTNIAGTKINTKTYKSGPSAMHNFKVGYTAHFGLNFGADYTLYDDKSDYFVQNEQQTSSALAEKLSYQSKQKIHRMIVCANQSHQLKNDWSINYGFNYSEANTQNRSDATQNDSVFEDASFDTKQKEHIWNFFAGISKSFSQKLSAQISLAAEYYKAVETRNGKMSILWDDVAWFPTLNASYNVSPNHVFQFSVSSDKTYPSYWRLNPSTYYVSSYTVMYGNPHLRPSRDYGIGITYINNRKYVMRAYFNYIPNYFTELPYQSHEKLEQKVISQNYNFRQNIGLMGVVPFKMGNRVSSRFVANVMYIREKDNEFFDISFDRKTVLGILNMNHDIILSNKPDLQMNISGYVTTPTGIQGLYDLSSAGNLSASVTWVFDRRRAKIILKADDVFNTRIPHTASIDYKGQKSTLKAYRYTRTISLSFIYRFGGYKEKQRKTVDTSRFGTN
ncbi:MAG: hypothetical protein BWZ00_01790 [Bacteroidetes bacterium ADurb.BinA174]|nr:MAG: hypothetical protein BWZ00_01790 [Bacteroidetes bacterium ADurb.BinA174]